MAPKGRSVKAKEQVEENGQEKRTRNVKAASYKDLSDSEDDGRARKAASEESNSEEEVKPKKRHASRRKTTPRRKKTDASESESELGSSEGDSDAEPKRKTRQPMRTSLRASKSTSYKDLSNSEDEVEPLRSEASAAKRKPKQKKIQKTQNESEDGASSDSGGKVKKESEKSQEKDADSASEDSNVESDEIVKKETNSGESSGKKEEPKSSKSALEGKESDGKSENTEEDEEMEEDTSEKNELSKKSKGSGRPEHEMSEEEDEEEETQKAPKRARAKKSDDTEQPLKKNKSNDGSVKVNKTGSDFESIDFSSNATTSDGKQWNLKISSWNVASIRALVKKNGFDYIKYEKPDILCLQETKCSESKLPPEVKVEGYHSYWLSGEKEGYAGVALLSKEKPLNVKYGIDVKDFDTDGRVITAEYEKFFVVNAYVPNAGQGLKTLPRRMEWDPAFRSHIKKLDERKPVILTGDLNVAHNEIDLANPKTNTKNAGFTPQEREGMTDLLKEGFVDSFRHLYPEKTGAYTFWTFMSNARSRNVGWRLDYFILSNRFLPNLCDNVMRSDVYGSDHCPITLFLNV